MEQKIIYEQENGQVAVCHPTGHISIEEVLAKDCPDHAFIVDTSDLPMADFDFLNAWRMNADKTGVVIDFPAAVEDIQKFLTQIAMRESQHRLTKVGAGLTNVLSDTDWLALLATARTAILNSVTLQNLRDAVSLVNDAIDNNKI